MSWGVWLPPHQPPCRRPAPSRNSTSAPARSAGPVGGPCGGAQLLVGEQGARGAEEVAAQPDGVRDPG
ncbi:hypothetical protein ACFWIZ_42835, partial [Streptomyces sp. NPDC127044]